MTRTGRRAIVVCAVVAAAVATAAPSPAAKATAGIRFIVHFQGSFEGSWRSTLTQPIDPVRFRCPGDDSWGAFKSSVRPAKPPVVVVGSEAPGPTTSGDPGVGEGSSAQPEPARDGCCS